MNNFSKVILAMKDLQGWRFTLLWIWLMTLAITALIHVLRWW